MKTLRYLIFLLSALLFSATNTFAGEPQNGPDAPVISGYIIDSSSGETLIGAAVYVEELKTGAISNVYGFYSLNIPIGAYTLTISYVGYEPLTLHVQIDNNISRNFELQPNNTTLKEVVITDRRADEHVRGSQMGSVKMNTETIKKVPALMGEVDILKTLQLLPGIQNTAEGFSGFSVRGGSSDQNMILLDEATVYNASHLMGFFSVFNSDAIKDMTIYKGDIPAHYGGRLSSLLDIRMKDGNSRKLSAAGGIGSISSRLTLEMPIVKDKSSILISGRRTYADMFLPLAKDTLMHNNQLFFYDLNMKANYSINNKNRIFLSTYYGRDVFSFRDVFDMRWGNTTQTLRWNHIFSDKIFVNTSLIRSQYDYSMDISQGLQNYVWNAGIKDLGLKTDFIWYANPSNTVRFGYNGYHHSFDPGVVTDRNNENLVKMSSNQSLEHIFYISNEQKVGKKLSLSYGIRLTAYQNVGKAKVFEYNDQYVVVDSAMYIAGEIYHTNIGPEPRFSAAWMLNSTTSLKGSYSRTRQNVQMASNSAAGMPIDMWFPSSPNVKPQISDQGSVGIFKNIKNNIIELSIEAYYKNMTNQIDFKDNANIYFNDKLEGEIRTGNAMAYGAEFLARKQYGSMTGWVSYTYSRARRTINGINNDNPYSAGHDKPHNLSIVLAYDLTERINVGLAWLFSSGAPITLPAGKWEHANTIIPAYTDRNTYRLPAYHRLDLSLTIQMNKKPNPKFKNELNISCFNAYNRKNPFTIFFEPDQDNPNKMKAYSMSMFGIVPSITWNFKF
jgi:hypothetical protein